MKYFFIGCLMTGLAVMFYNWYLVKNCELFVIVYNENFRDQIERGYKQTHGLYAVLGFTLICVFLLSLFRLDLWYRKNQI